MRQFRRGTDYKAEFILAVNELIAEKIADRQERMRRIDSLINAYVEGTGETPNGKQLERLTDYILMEELTDTDRLKSRNTEYPFFSERQLERREGGEAPFKMAEEVGTDGRNYKTPTRRKRAPHENNFVDATAKIRNDERRRQYRKDTAIGELISYVL
jgi:hypothetical protein